MGNVFKGLNPVFFYVPIFIIGIFAALRFAIQSGFNNSTLGVGLAVGFIAMGAVGFFLLPLYLLRFGKNKMRSTFSGHLHSFWIGIAVAVVIGIAGMITGFTIVSIPQSVLATASEGLSTYDTILATTIMAPFNETFVFVGHLLFSLVIVTILKRMVKLDEKTANIVLFLLFIVFSTATFYTFHVGLVGSVSFLIAVLVYRTLMGVFVLGDKLFNLIPFMTVALAFEFGFHFANNVISTVGFVQWALVMTTDWIGIVALLFFVFYAGAEIYNIRTKGEVFGAKK